MSTLAKLILLFLRSVKGQSLPNNTYAARLISTSSIFSFADLTLQASDTETRPYQSQLFHRPTIARQLGCLSVLEAIWA